MKKAIYVAANWKMHKTLQEGLELGTAFSEYQVPRGVTAVVNAPAIHLAGLAEAFANGNGWSAGAQNCHQAESGAYTGEISAGMIASTGARYVVLGHSERRIYFQETDALVLDKIRSARRAGLIPIYCCGESLDIRESGAERSYVERQLNESILQLDPEEIGGVWIAYEPVWAIGTGRTASPQQAQDMHAFIRQLLSDRFGRDVAASVPVLYGGSCNPANARELFSLADVDGGLIGGASLKYEDFTALLRIAGELIGS